MGTLGCGSSQPSRETVKVEDIKNSELYAAVQLPAQPDETLVKAGSKGDGAAYVSRYWQLPQGTSPRSAFDDALKRLTASGVAFNQPDCAIYTAEGLARISSTFKGRPFWPGSVSLVAESRVGQRVGSVTSPLLALKISVSYGSPADAQPDVSPAPRPRC
jgi:hypothetical protein